MISQCCARCGLPLDASHRRHAATVACWVASCPRCGFASRWSLRAAREPARIWARLRALNTRLGISVGAAHGAAFALVGLSAHLFDNATEIRLFAAIGPVRRGEIIAVTVALATLAAILAAISALAFAPSRGLLAGTTCAWLVGILPMYLVVAAFLLMVEVADGGNLDRGLWARLRDLHRAGRYILPVFALIPLASLALAFALSPLIRFVRRLQARSHRHALIAARRGLRAAGAS